MAKLSEYKKKRDFSKTPEPVGKVKASKKPIFVVQKHHATRLHYDFRLENEGVLLSWAVPKGPSMNPGDKRLAVHVEDHPLDYGDFEGTIPKGQYGGGTVMLWDFGTYDNMTEKYGKRISISEGMKVGHVTVRLSGTKLRGIFTVVKTRNFENQNQWLLFKKKDGFASEQDVLKLDKSAKTGRTMQEIAEGIKGSRKWSSRKEDSKFSIDFTGKKYDVEFTNTNKVLFQESGYTKSDLIEYYYRISDYILEHLKGRPISMLRFPSGIKGEHFFQKDSPEYFPDWIKKVKIPKERGITNYAVCNDIRTLLYLANQVIVPHTWLSRIDNLDFPDKMIFDLDPQNEHLEDVGEGAKILRDILDNLGLRSFAMSTGSRGIHVVVPLDGKLNYKKVSSFARVIAKHLAKHDPEKFTSAQRKEKRIGNVFIDTYRNAYSQTAVAPYSVRTIEGAPVAAPLDWSEVRKNFNPKRYNIKNVFINLKKKGDPWRGFFEYKQSLKKAVG